MPTLQSQNSMLILQIKNNAFCSILCNPFEIRPLIKENVLEKTNYDIQHILSVPYIVILLLAIVLQIYDRIMRISQKLFIFVFVTRKCSRKINSLVHGTSPQFTEKNNQQQAQPGGAYVTAQYRCRNAAQLKHQ